MDKNAILTRLMNEVRVDVLASTSFGTRYSIDSPDGEL